MKEEHRDYLGEAAESLTDEKYGKYDMKKKWCKHINLVEIGGNFCYVLDECSLGGLKMTPRADDWNFCPICGKKNPENLS